MLHHVRNRVKLAGRVFVGDKARERSESTSEYDEVQAQGHNDKHSCLLVKLCCVALHG